MARFKFKKLNNMEESEQYPVIISNQRENLDDDMNFNSLGNYWKEYKNFSQTESRFLCTEAA
jgi:hypothetical protein